MGAFEVLDDLVGDLVWGAIAVNHQHIGPPRERVADIVSVLFVNPQPADDRVLIVIGAALDRPSAV
jgi:hypothetical protein